MAQESPLGILEMLFLPPDDQRRMHWILAGGLGGGFPRFDLPYDLQLEFTRKATAFESQGCCLLSVDKEA
jgi:hypothetical protein